MASNIPEHIKAHRELEYLRAVGSIPKKKGKKMTAAERRAEQKAKKRAKERYAKLRQVSWDE